VIAVVYAMYKHVYSNFFCIYTHKLEEFKVSGSGKIVGTEPHPVASWVFVELPRIKFVDNYIPDDMEETMWYLLRNLRNPRSTNTSRTVSWVDVVLYLFGTLFDTFVNMVCALHSYGCRDRPLMSFM
jgi:hypothetical protein